MSPVEAVSGPTGPNRAVAAPSAPAQQAPAYAWLNGRVVPFDQCVIHARTQGAFWGANVFEGLRGYWREQDQQLSVFRPDDHLARLGRSMKSLHMPAPYGDEEIKQACLDLLAANDFRQDVHVCVVAYFGMGPNFETMSHTDDVGDKDKTTLADKVAGVKG